MNRRMRGPHVRWCERGRGNPGPYSIHLGSAARSPHLTPEIRSCKNPGVEV